MIAGHLVTCKNCHTRTVVFDGQNVHDALTCRCCGSDHQHAGQDGVTVNEACRNVVISVNAFVGPALGPGDFFGEVA